VAVVVERDLAKRPHRLCLEHQSDPMRIVAMALFTQ